MAATKPNALKIETLSLDSNGGSPTGGLNSIAPTYMTPLPSPVASTTFPASSSSGGDLKGSRTRDFFGVSLSPSMRPTASWAALESPVPRQRTVSNESATRSPLSKSVSHASTEPLSSLPSALQTSPQRATKPQYGSLGIGVDGSLGLGGSPKLHFRNISDPAVPSKDLSLVLPPPSRLPSLSQSVTVASSKDTGNKRISISETSTSPTAISFGDRSIRCIDEEIDTRVGSLLNGEYVVQRKLGDGAFSEVVLAERKRPLLERPPSPPRSLKRSRRDTLNNLVAIKVIDNNTCARNDRMRISVLREIEVLKHIHHPSLVHLLDSFGSKRHTCLVLEYSAGGELFTIMAKHHRQFTEAFVKRVFGELADVIGWIHGIGLVHRDIKLENILLTVNPFESPDQTLPSLLVKLTDFGLSRFVDLDNPVLRTRCGSEEYAAPELIMGQPYDGRQTDAWALGVVLYALLVGALPFTAQSLAAKLHETPVRSDDPLSRQMPSQSPPAQRSRRSYLMKIAKADFEWPAFEQCPLATPDARHVVGTLLQRDTASRIRVQDLWTLPWMTLGSGNLIRRRSQMKRNSDGTRSREGSRERRRSLSRSQTLQVEGLPVSTGHPHLQQQHLSPVVQSSPSEQAEEDWWSSSSEDDVVWVKEVAKADAILHAELEPM